MPLPPPIDPPHLTRISTRNTPSNTHAPHHHPPHDIFTSHNPNVAPFHITSYTTLLHLPHTHHTYHHHLYTPTKHHTGNQQSIIIHLDTSTLKLSHAISSSSSCRRLPINAYFCVMSSNSVYSHNRHYSTQPPPPYNPLLDSTHVAHTLPHTFTVHALRHTKHSHSFTLPYTHTTTSHSHHTNLTPQHHHLHHHPYNTPIHPPRYPTTTTTTCAIHAPPPPHTHRTYHHHHHLRTPITHRTINQPLTHSPPQIHSQTHTLHIFFPPPFTIHPPIHPQRRGALSPPSIAPYDVCTPPTHPSPASTHLDLSVLLRAHDALWYAIAESCRNCRALKDEGHSRQQHWIGLS